MDFILNSFKLFNWIVILGKRAGKVVGSDIFVVCSMGPKQLRNNSCLELIQSLVE